MEKVEVRKIHHSNGKVLEKTPYVDGRQHGVAKVYYKSGRLSYQTPFKNGEIHGVEISFYDNEYIHKIFVYKSNTHEFTLYFPWYHSLLIRIKIIPKLTKQQWQKIKTS